MVSEPEVALISCAKDTYSGFGGNLLKSLKNRGYRTKVVSDDHHALTTEELERFRIFIIVLSDLYATCQFRLDKLVEIVNEFGKTKRRRVLPVFFDVNPFDVKYQKASFEIAFDTHKNYVNSDKLNTWQDALTWVGRIHGWHFKRSGNTYEHIFVEEIIQTISVVVPCAVGLYPRVKAVNDLLNSESDDGVLMLGVYGESGIGKTTVVREVYNSNGFKKFDSYCFLDKVGECLKTRGVVGLIKEILLKIGDSDSEVESADEPMSILKQHVEQKKSFLVLEDILDKHQLQGVVEVVDCLGSNSKVIITAVDNYFQKYPQIKLYEEKGLDKNEAFDLLCLKAFNLKEFLDWNAVDVFQRASTIACRVPLILEVIGSYLGGKSRPSWTSILDQYENIKVEKKQGILQMSFDDLNVNQQEYLIFIATALEKKEFSKVEYLRGQLKDDIKVLCSTSLIKVNEHDLVTMHDLTQNMVKGQVTISLSEEK